MVRLSPRRPGVTLIELVLGTAIIVILLTVMLVMLKPSEELSNASIARARSEAQELTKAVRLFAVDEHVLPHGTFAFATGGTVMPICTETYAASAPTDCVDLRPLKNKAYVPSLPLYRGVATASTTGFFYRVCNGGEKFVDVVIADDATGPVPCTILAVSSAAAPLSSSSSSSTPPSSSSSSSSSSTSTPGALDFTPSGQGRLVTVNGGNFNFDLGTPFTISFWTKLNGGLTSPQTFVSKLNASGRGFAIGWDNSLGTVSMSLSQDNTHGLGVFPFNVPLPTNVWTHVACRYQGTGNPYNMRCEVNIQCPSGVCATQPNALRDEAPAVPATVSTFANAQNLQFGSGYLYDSPTINSYNLQGSMDEIKIYNVYLSDNEVGALNDSNAVNDRATNLIGYWRFNDGSGGLAADQVNNAQNSGALSTPAPVWVAPGANVPQ